jgi:hypothetical protein
MKELDEWVARLTQELGVPAGDVVVNELLDLAKEAAHNVARPAAPITTFVVGYVAGLRGGGAGEIARTISEALAVIPGDVDSPDSQ